MKAKLDTFSAHFDTKKIPIYHLSSPPFFPHASRTKWAVEGSEIGAAIKQTRPGGGELRPTLPATRQHTPTNAAWETRLKPAPSLPLC